MSPKFKRNAPEYENATQKCMPEAQELNTSRNQKFKKIIMKLNNNEKKNKNNHKKTGPAKPKPGPLFSETFIFASSEYC